MTTIKPISPIRVAQVETLEAKPTAGNADDATPVALPLLAEPKLLAGPEAKALPPGPTTKASNLAAVRTLEAPVKLTLVRELALTASPSAGRGSFLAAASGIVVKGEHVLIVADDETQLAVFKRDPRAGDAPGTSFPLFADVLPADEKARKKVKPDLEALTIIGDKALALGSGSTDARYRGALITLDEAGAPTAAKTIDLSALYKELLKRFPELNVEGATVVGDALWLFQRGNGAKGEDAIVKLDLAAVERGLTAGAIDAAAIRSVTPMDLGTLSGTKLSFTDACALPDGRVVFIAAAEASASTFNDGEVHGSAVGILEKDGSLSRVRHLSPVIKAEGVHAELASDGSIALTIVNDADDPGKPGKWFEASF